jgi:hypothetical protein
MWLIKILVRIDEGREVHEKVNYLIEMQTGRVERDLVGT